MTFVLKLESSGDIRRSVCSAAFSLGDLVSLAQSAWGIQVPSFSYTDSDGDNISIVNSSDWRAAVDFGVSQSLLRVKVSRDGRSVVLDQQAPGASSSSAAVVPIDIALDTASRAVDLYEQGNSTEGIALLEKALESDDPNNVVLMLLTRLFYRTWPESLCSRVHQVDPCTSLLTRAKNASSSDHTSAEQYLRTKVTTQPNSTWSFLLGILYDGAIDAPDAAVVHFREAIERGGRASALARSALGLLFETGRGVYMSASQAKQYYADGARLGDPSSMCNYARLLEGDERREWLLRAANTRLGVAMFNYAIEEGITDSLQWLEAAAKLGVDVAQYELGLRRRDGTGGCEKDDIEAVSWLASAAEQGNINAKYILGTIYLEGAGDVIEKNVTEAVRLFTEAAEAGLGNAQYMLGSLYEAGSTDDAGGGVAQDLTQAFQMYLRAATGGHRSAQLEVGSMYAEGRGVVASEAEAQKWFLLATGETAFAAEDLASTRAEINQLQQSQPPTTSAPLDATASLFSSTGSVTAAAAVIESQESIKQRLLDGGFVGTYYTWTSVDGGASWEPSARVVLDGEATLIIGDEAQSGQQFASNLTNPEAIDVTWGGQASSASIYGEITFAAGAVESDAIWGEDLSKDSKLFSGWIEPYGQVRAAIRGIREDASSVEFRWFVPEASSLEQSMVSPVISSTQLQTLRTNMLSLESFMIRSAVQWNGSTGERQQWARAVKHAELGSHLGACLLQLMTNINQDFAPNIATVVEQYRTIFAPGANNVLVRQVAEALLAVEVNLPWSAVVPIFRTYRSEWVGTLRAIVDEPNAEVQQTLHTSILTGAARNRDINSAVVAFPQHSPLYSLPSGLAVLDSVRIRAQVQSTLNENLLFNINFNGNTPATHEFQLSFKRSAGDTGIVSFNYGYGHNSEVVAAEGHPFPAVAEDFDVLFTINADQSISITIEPLGISHTSAPLGFLSIPDINRVQLESPHGRVLIRTFIHSYTRSTVIHPGTGESNTWQ